MAGKRGDRESERDEEKVRDSGQERVTQNEND